jgi:beta-lactamase class A
MRNTLFYIVISIGVVIFNSACNKFAQHKKNANPMLTNNIKPNGTIDPFLNELLQKDSFVASILNNPSEYQAQIIYTKIDRNLRNEPTFETHSIAADSNFYFYPASTVKMPVAFLALQKLNELNAKGIDVYADMVMLTGKSTKLQTAVKKDTTAFKGYPSVAHYIKKIFLVSDNDAFNRLYEFLGQDYINSNLQKMGYTSAEILHRLSVSLPKKENRITNPIEFYDKKGESFYKISAQKNATKYKARNDFRGKGYMKGDSLKTD